MIRPRLRKILSDLWSNKVRSMLVIASIGVGLLAVGIITIIWVVVTNDMRQGYMAVNPANLQVHTIAPFDQDLVTRISHIDGVKDAEGVYTTSMRVRTGPGEWTGVSFQAFQDFSKMNINRVEVVEGAWPPQRDEMVVDRVKLADLHAKIGDSIDVELPSGGVVTLKLVGVIHDQTIGASGLGGEFFLAGIQAYISTKTLPHLEHPEAFNHLYITALTGINDTAHLNLLSVNVRKAVENTGLIIASALVRRAEDHPNSTYIDAIAGVLLLLGLFVVFLSGFLVTNTISALLTQQVPQIGVMKTVGARRYQIISIYMTVIFIYGVLACLIAVPLSDLASRRIIEFLSVTINFAVLPHGLTPLAVWLQVFIALLVPQIAGFSPILHASSISVQEAVSGITQATHAVKKSWVDRQIAGIKSSSWLWIIALRNAFRRKGRLALTLLTLSLGGAVFIGTFNVRSSINAYITQVGKYFLADVNLTLDRPYRLDRMTEELSSLPQVRKVEGWTDTAAGILNTDDTVGENMHLLATPPDSQLIEPVMISGRWIKNGDQNAIVLNERFLSQFPNVYIGDTIRLKIKGDKTAWVVVGFFQLAGKSGGFLGYTNYYYLSDLVGESNRAQSFRILAQKSGQTLDEQNLLGRQIEAHLKDAGVRVVNVTAGASLYSQSSSGLNALTVFLLIMAVLIALVGSIGLAGTMSMNVMERTREIGVMRSIGASDSVLNRLVLIEGVIIGLISWLLGALLSFPISKLMSDTINRAIFDATTGFTFTPDGLIIWLVVVVILSISASLLPARNATRLTIREVLSYE